MQHIFDGIYLGLTLAILLGPIFIVLIQVSLEHGTLAGLVAGSGIWISDIIIVYFTLLFVRQIQDYVYQPSFIFWVGLLGGAVLVIVGMISFFKKSTLNFETSYSKKASSWFGFWVKGFLVNTINPFTFIFWLSTITTYVATKQLDTNESYVFGSIIIAMIIMTDSLKVLLAKLIRQRITPQTLSAINKTAGVALVVFGFVLMFRSVLY